MKTKCTTRSTFVMAFLWMLFLGWNTASYGQTLATVGDDFWLGFMHNTGSSNEELRLFVSSETPTTGTVEIPLLGWSTTFTVVPNTTTTILVPLLQGETTTNDQVDQKGIHVTTNDPVSLFAINFSVFSADASKILPASSLGTDYLVSAYRGISGFSRSEFLIVATEDNTELEITPSVTTQGGHAAGVPYLINLNEGETYQVRSNSTNDDLTGTRITATDSSGTCRPFGVFAGTQCANVPTTCTTCDHLFDQQYPLYAWGDRYLMPPFQSTGVYTYRILAKENNTQVSIDGGLPQMLNSGQFLEVNNEALPREITSNAPIQVMQFMQGDNCSSNGDPAMLALNPDGQQISYVTFSTVSSTVITNHFLNLVVQTTNVGTVLLDNVPIATGSFTQFPSNPSMSFAQVPIPQGSHTVYAVNGFTGYIYGMGTAESYAYSLGSFLDEPVLPVDTIICTTTGVTLIPPINLFQPEWTALSNPGTILSTTNSLSVSAPIVTDVYVVEGVSPLSGCPETYTFSVSSPDSFSLNIFTDQDTVCAFNSIQAHVDVSSPGFYEYEWWPSFAFNDPANDSTVLSPPSSGWYGVTVSNFGGNCVEISDSVYIEVIPGNVQSIAILASDTMVCSSDTVTLEAVTNELLFFDEFSGGGVSSLWTSVIGAVNSATCGSLSGNALFFNGAPTRYAETSDIDVGSGGQLQFYIKVATGAIPCDDAEFGENILLEYSVNGGATWNLWTTLFEFDYPVATLVTIPIPLPAQSSNTRFRWLQPNFSGVNEDVWWLDNVMVTGTSSNSGLQYEWTPTTGLTTPQSASTELIPVVSGWYFLQVGSGMCSYQDSVFIEVEESYTLELLQDTILCGNQAVDMEAVVTGNSNVQLTWEPLGVLTSISGTQVTVMPNVDTTIYVTASTAGGCFSVIDSATISNHFGSISLTGDSVLCLGANGTLTATVTSSSGPLNLSWFQDGVQIPGNMPSITINPTSSSMYTAVVDDPFSDCSWSDSLFVVVDDFSVDAGPDTILCQTLGYTLNGVTNASSPSISWSPSGNLSNSTILQPTINTNATATYTLIVSDGVCAYFDDVTVTYTAANNIALPDDTTTCQGTSVNVDFSGTQNVVWSPGTGVTSTGSSYELNPGSTTTYTVNYVSSNNCSVTDTMDIVVLALPSVSLPADTTLCPGFPVTITPVTSPFGGTYNWSSGGTNPQITTNIAGLYWLDYTTQCGTVSDSIVVDYYPNFTATLGTDTTTCAGDVLNIAVSGSGAATYQWNDGSTGTSVNVVSPSQVSVIADDGNGCLQTDTLVISSFPLIVTGLPAFTQTCEDDSVLLDATSQQVIDYLWNTGETAAAIFVSAPGTYIVSMTDANGCTAEDSVSFSTLQVTSPVITGPTDYCSNEIAEFSVQGAFSQYSWSTGSTTSTTSITGVVNEISIVTTDANGCIAHDTLQLNSTIVPEIDLGEDIVLCDTHSVVLDGTTANATGYLWEPINASVPTVDVLPGAYELIVSFDDCSASDQIVISVEPYELDLGEDQYLCRDHPVFLVHSMINIDSLIWYDGSEGGAFHLQTDLFWEDSIVISAMAFGCDVQMDSVTIYLEDCECNIFIPNTFTPNGDEMNPVFKAYQECPMSVFEFRIFNRWGEVIFESNDPDFGWDGTLSNGMEVQQGTYTWQLRFLAEFDLQTDYREMVGHVNVIR